jgi:hypothetical protein
MVGVEQVQILNKEKCYVWKSGLGREVTLEVLGRV